MELSNCFELLFANAHLLDAQTEKTKGIGQCANLFGLQRSPPAIAC